MKRKSIILGSVFIFFLVLGIWLNGQKGMNLLSDFWVLEKDGSLTHQDNRIFCVDNGSGKKFEITLGETVLTATVEEQEDGWYMETNRGWGVKIPSENYLSVMVGGIIFVGDAQLVIQDIGAMDLDFEAVKAEEKNYMYGENGRPVEIIKDGMTLDSENYQNKLFVNEEGEYLMNPNCLFMISDGQEYISKGGLLQALVKVAEGEVEQRGHLSLAVAYIFFYALGVAILLWPQEMAFFGHRWRYRFEPELSDEGLMMEMLGGVVIIFMAIVMLFLPLAGR